MNMLTKLSIAIASICLTSGCTSWSPAGAGGMAEHEGDYPYPIETSADLHVNQGLRIDYEIQRNALDLLILQGAKHCFPARVWQATERENRIIRALTGGLIDDAAIDITNQRDNLKQLDTMLAIAIKGGSCRPSVATNQWLMNINHGINKDNLFAIGSDEITPKYQNSLNRSIEILRNKADYQLYIIGHTDPKGDHYSNQLLSERRANNVAAFLIENGIPNEAIVTIGYGERLKRYPGSSPHIDLANRRVEIHVSSSTFN